jgi:hypothetical protein
MRPGRLDTLGEVMVLSKFRLLALGMVSCLILLSSPAVAEEEDLINPDRPGIADGSAVIGPGRVQIELGLQEEFRKDGDVRDRRLFNPSLVRVGLTHKFELRVETSGYTFERSRDPASGTTNTKGLNPISIGGKYQFQTSNGIAHPSLGIIARVFPPSGSGGFKTRHATGDVRLAADWDVASKLSLNPNIGVAAYEDADGTRFVAALFALTLNYNPTKHLNFFVDTGEQAPEQKNGRTSSIVDAGIAYIVGKDTQLDFSVGTKVTGRTPPRPFIALGISERF